MGHANRSSERRSIASSDDVKHTLREALRLPSAERAVLVEKLISSLDQPDPRLDELWAAEAEDRLAAFHAGEMKAFAAEEVFKDREDA